MFKAILFDLDDTLIWDKKSIQDAFSATCQLVENRFSIDSKEFEATIREEAKKLFSSYEIFPVTQRIGVNPYEGLWGDFTGNDERDQLFKNGLASYRRDAWTSALQKFEIHDSGFGYELGEFFVKERMATNLVYEDTFSVLDTLKNDFRIALITNGSSSLQSAKLELTPELDYYLEHVVISGSFGIGKPDPSIFDFTLRLLDLKRDEVLMVGDNLSTDILGATRAGIQSVWINREGQQQKDIHSTFEITRLEELLKLIE